MIKEIVRDLNCVESNSFLTFISNRGFHALLIYRISNYLWRKKIPLLPLIMTRFIQIIYGIDIDYRAKINGGCCIVHGVGLVIGRNAEIGSNVKLYHGVTLGLSHSETKKDGFPTLGNNVLVGAGAKLLGKINIGDNVKIGANSVVTKDIPSNSVAVGIPAKYQPISIKEVQIS